MLFLKNSVKPIIISFAILIISILMLTIFSYFNIFGTKLTLIFKFIIIFGAFFTSGIMIGQKSHNKGWLNGIKLGLIQILILLLFQLLGLFKTVNLMTLLYYIIILGIVALGGIIGINYKKN